MKKETDVEKLKSTKKHGSCTFNIETNELNVKPNSTPNNDKAELYDLTISNMQRIGNKTLVAIPRKLLKVDPTYQRLENRSQEKINYLVKNWDTNKMSPITVVPHPEEYMFAIVDGYGRYTASGMLTEPFTKIVADVIIDAPNTIHARKIYEAKLFVEQTKGVETLKAIQKHKANVLLGVKECIEIEQVCNKHNVFFVSNSGQRNKGILGSYTDTLRICKSQGKDCLDWIFGIIEQSHWSELLNGYNTVTLRMLKSIYAWYPEMRMETAELLVAQLRQTTPEKFKASAVHTYPKKEVKTACSLYLEDIVTGNLNLVKNSPEKIRVI